MKTIHYVNLTSGIEFLPRLVEEGIQPRFLRIQSTACEQHLWDKLLSDLDYDFLMNLALGNICVIYDCGTGRPVSRAVYQGLEFIQFTLNRRWLKKDYQPYIVHGANPGIRCYREFDH